jgi:hypothetical protein
MMITAVCAVAMLGLLPYLVNHEGSVGAAGTFEPLAAPQRLLDTRPGELTADHQFEGIGVRSAGTTLELRVAGRVGIPADATAVVLNLTVTQPQAAGHATIFPCGVDQPNASNVNFNAGQTIPNAVVAKIGTNGDICLFTLASAHYIVDVSGYLIGDPPATNGSSCPAPLPPPTTTAPPTTTTTTTPPSNCHPSYPTVCIPPPPPDLNCDDIPYNNFTVLAPDPHNFDGNHDGVGCVT